MSATATYLFRIDLSDALPDHDYMLCVENDEYPLTGARATVTVPMPADAARRIHVAGVARDRSRPEYVHLAAIVYPPPVVPDTTITADIDYPSTARAFLFHHPELLSVDPAVAATVMQHMDEETAPETYEQILALALEMKSQGPPTEREDRGWAQLIPFVDSDNLVHYIQRPSPRTVRAAARPMELLQLTTKNDLRLSGKTWTQEQGLSVITSDLPDGPAPVARLETAGESVTVKPELATRLHGLRTFVEQPKTPGSGVRAHVRIENYFLRFLGVYIQFLDADGNIMQTPKWKPDDSSGAPVYVEELPNLRWLDGPGPPDTILGIPNPLLPGSLEHDITFPEGAAAARLYALGLGTGVYPYQPQNLYGSYRTLIGNLAIPVLLLPFGVALQTHKPLKEFFEDPQVGNALKALGAVYAAYIGVGSAVNGKIDWQGLSTIGKTIFSAGFEKIAAYLLGVVRNGMLKRYIPFVGWAMAAIDTLTNIAQITQTLVAVSTSPASIQNRLTVEIETTVKVLPDPAVDAFPGALASVPRTLNVRLVYQGNQPTRSVTKNIPANSTDTVLTVTLPNNLGGRVKVQCEFLVGNDVAASATTSFLRNDGIVTKEVTLALFQKRVELTKETEYKHARLLTFQDDRYVWMETAEAPVSTRASLDASPRGNAISDLAGVSLSQRHRQLGYAWKAAGLGIVDCVSGGGDTQLYALQGIDIPGRPVDNARFSGCAYSSLAAVAWDPYPPRFKRDDGGQYVIENGRPVPDPEDRDLGLYYVDPSRAGHPEDEGGGYHLRRIANGGSAPINEPGAATSYGRFRLPVDALVLHPSGRVLAINTGLSELMTTTLETEGRRDDEVPFARSLAGPALDYTPPGGTGTLRRRPGLLIHPIAIASTYDGTVLVLEDVVQSPAVSRLQAFDANGNPVNAFPEGPFLDLPTGRQYLDLAVAGNADLTDIYILYYERDGAEPGDYHLAVYQSGRKVPKDNPSPLLTTPRVSAARIAVDLFRTLYTLNWSMTTDGRGHPAGPRRGPAGPAGRTVPSLSQWLPEGAQ
ncbi:MAG TPA: hypothetical protein VEO54_17045 [Thermoanaerobaculia bacterium]|nr:hypothetical protein [Thermoanaerobaculia bacterium]